MLNFYEEFSRKTFECPVGISRCNIHQNYSQSLIFTQLLLIAVNLITTKALQDFAKIRHIFLRLQVILYRARDGSSARSADPRSGADRRELRTARARPSVSVGRGSPQKHCCYEKRDFPVP